MHEEIKTRVIPYSFEKDGPLNPALKILDGKNQNKIAHGRWEIFVVLENELGEVSLRSGVKSKTSDYSDLQVSQQFDFSFFSAEARQDIQSRLLAYRNGHPSLALNFKSLEAGVNETLPVYSGGWLIRNDFLSQKRLQVYWSSGRYNNHLSTSQTHLLQLCTGFNLMMEYGTDFQIEFYGYKACTMNAFINMKAEGGPNYTWDMIKNEVDELMHFDLFGNLILDNPYYPWLRANIQDCKTRGSKVNSLLFCCLYTARKDSSQPRLGLVQ